jgi:hypothetical protein
MIGSNIDMISEGILSAGLDEHKPSYTTQEKSFCYDCIEPEKRELAESCARDIRMLSKKNVQNVIEIGRMLCLAKESLGHGNFERWLRSEFCWGMWTARKFMQVARQFGSENLENLSIDTSALYYLSAPSTNPEIREEAIRLAQKGETVTRLKVMSMEETCSPKNKEVSDSAKSISYRKESVPQSRPQYFSDSINQVTEGRSHNDVGDGEAHIVDEELNIQVGSRISVVCADEKSTTLLGKVIGIENCDRGSTTIKVLLS